MSSLAVVLLIIWTLLIGVWLVRLPADQLYAERPWVYLWLTLRALLRLGLGIFAVLAWDTYRMPSPSYFYALIVESTCPESWTSAEKVAYHLLDSGQRVGLLIATPAAAFWGIPPTVDRQVFSYLLSTCRLAASPAPKAANAEEAARQLRSYNERLIAAIWLGRFHKTESIQGRHFSLCDGTESAEINLNQLPSPPLSERSWYGLGFLLCLFLLLVGEGYFYLTRKHLPLRTQA